MKQIDDIVKKYWVIVMIIFVLILIVVSYYLGKDDAIQIWQKKYNAVVVKLNADDKLIKDMSADCLP